MTTHALASYRRTLHDHPLAAAIELVCRAGYVARGFVYVSIGFIALLAALDRTPKAEGAMGALEAWADWPLGLVLLWLIGAGLFGFAAWRALQSVFDADRQGRKLKALASRAGQAISGVVYASLGFSVYGLIDALEDLREVDDQAKTREGLETALALPGGELMVIAVGLFVLGVGVGNIWQAATNDFSKQMSCDRKVGRWVSLLGRVGYFARGVAFLPAGGFLMLAGLNTRAGEAQGGLGAALDALERQPFGGAILALTALGLMAFGLFAFAEARYRRMNVDDVVDA
ncbi:DUF1206 domain-containing protein [Phenylobacterium sp. LH3H17]|uniref:DUF1206 domain-containing protein n=1 Tax=Phenylobacterium sp. LH3H17 TaxID=2903901 RepID=UPI0020CA086B|nr:DUF1206 domain-containing protein [Phenylobacterium sp. LH3H17]UTP39557.1 DUF1206 domain-containing protein [Phenylobacterium sp. LH3H17]